MSRANRNVRSAAGRRICDPAVQREKAGHPLPHRFVWPLIARDSLKDIDDRFNGLISEEIYMKTYETSYIMEKMCFPANALLMKF